MGGGNYNVSSARSRSFAYASSSRGEVFTQRNMNKSLDVHDAIRESCDSEEHPESYPIIIGLDVTGSMGRIPHELISGGLPNIMERLKKEGIEQAQICFLAIGDHYTDRAPIQVGQFETSDELQEKWLKLIWLEGGGGGNNGESYHLAWYFAAKHTKIDSFEKRGIKGTLITIGDEAVHRCIEKNCVKDIFGLEGGSNDIMSSAILSEAKEKWNVYHINVNDYIGSTSHTQNCWKEMLSDKFTNTENAIGNDIPDLLAGIILSSFREENKGRTNCQSLSAKENSVQTDFQSDTVASSANDQLVAAVENRISDAMDNVVVKL